MSEKFDFLHILLFTFVTALTPSAGMSEVIYPPDMTLTGENTITIYGFAEEEAPDGGEVNFIRKFELEGDDFYQGEVELFPGMNVISLEEINLKVFFLEKGGLDSFKMLSGERELTFHAYRVHPALEEGCEPCHEYDEGDISLSGEVNTLCVECHDDPAKESSGDKKAYIHSPVEEDECTACHEPHFSKNDNLLAEEIICLECHDDEGKKAGEKGSIHRPAGMKECESCHDPHASAFKYQLKKEIPDLCFGCHGDLLKGEDGKAIAFVHEPVAEGDCVSCHNPHASRSRKLLTGEKICLECHDDKDPEGKEGLTVHNPVNALKCVSCHDPHASSNAYQLVKKGNALCYGCHAEPHMIHVTVPEEGTDTHVPEKFPVEEGGNLSCLGCHDPHFTANRRLFNEEEAKLCIKCHRM